MPWAIFLLVVKLLPASKLGPLWSCINPFGTAVQQCTDSTFRVVDRLYLLTGQDLSPGTEQSIIPGRPCWAVSMPPKLRAGSLSAMGSKPGWLCLDTRTHICINQGSQTALTGIVWGEKQVEKFIMMNWLTKLEMLRSPKIYCLSARQSENLVIWFSCTLKS